MKWSESHIFTLKEAPNDAEISSHILMLRAGLIKKLAPGLYTYGNLALRAMRKFETIVREELDSQGCLEILMPLVQPEEIWRETGRWDEMGAGLLKFKNRNNHSFCLGATHEEVVTDFVRKDIKSYRDLPVSLYQIQTKFRDEIRPRFGLMRCREFLMKDAYSFDESKERSMETYEKMFKAYQNIFSRLGLKFKVVQADSGNIGGNLSQEFHILAESGEDHLMVSEDGEFAANAEVCPAIDYEIQHLEDKELKIEKFETKGLKTIKSLSKFLNLGEDTLVKTLFYSAAEDVDSIDRDNLKELKPFAILLRGSDEVNEVKLKNFLGLSNPPKMLTDKEVNKVSASWPGSCGPVGLDIPVYADRALKTMNNIIVGANEKHFHFRNVNHPRDFKVKEYFDVRMAKSGDRNPCGEGKLKSYRGIEVGHIFYLGTKYSQSMKASFLNKEGEINFLEMGCYGIGISRSIQAAIEQSHDKDGIIWPLSIAPFPVHICCLDPKDELVMRESQRVYDDLKEIGIESLMDDRNERPGVKFKDADLLGMPLRITIGARGLKVNEIEALDRKTKEVKKIRTEELIVYVKDFVSK